MDPEAILGSFRASVSIAADEKWARPAEGSLIFRDSSLLFLTERGDIQTLLLRVDSLCYVSHLPDATLLETTRGDYVVSPDPGNACKVRSALSELVLRGLTARVKSKDVGAREAAAAIEWALDCMCSEDLLEDVIVAEGLVGAGEACISEGRRDEARALLEAVGKVGTVGIFRALAEICPSICLLYGADPRSCIEEPSGIESYVPEEQSEEVREAVSLNRRLHWLQANFFASLLGEEGARGLDLLICRLQQKALAILLNSSADRDRVLLETKDLRRLAFQLHSTNKQALEDCLGVIGLERVLESISRHWDTDGLFVLYLVSLCSSQVLDELRGILISGPAPPGSSFLHGLVKRYRRLVDENNREGIFYAENILIRIADTSETERSRLRTLFDNFMHTLFPEIFEEEGAPLAAKAEGSGTGHLFFGREFRTSESHVRLIVAFLKKDGFRFREYLISSGLLFHVFSLLGDPGISSILELHILKILKRLALLDRPALASHLQSFALQKRIANYIEDKICMPGPRGALYSLALSLRDGTLPHVPESI